jgi:uncharacterized membrane protein YkvA (DUF1232 family)
MAQKEKKQLKSEGGIFSNIGNEIRLVMRLLGDPRIGWWLKLLPFGTLVYFVFPDIAPGPIDDALVIGVGVYLFVEMCPTEIVEEHREALRNTINGEWRDPETSQDDEVVEAEFKEE